MENHVVGGGVIWRMAFEDLSFSHDFHCDFNVVSRSSGDNLLSSELKNRGIRETRRAGYI